MGSFEHKSHTADVLIHASGKDFADALDGAVKGFCAVVTDVKKVKPAERLDVFLKAKTAEELVYDFISELVYGLDADGLLPCAAEVKVREAEDGFVVEGVVLGDESRGYQTHGDIKAVTMHQLAVKHEHGKVAIEFVLDL